MVVCNNEAIRTDERSRPPSLNRTLERRRWWSHCWVGVKLYLFFSCSTGGLSNVHIPSSARGDITAAEISKNNNRMKRWKGLLMAHLVNVVIVLRKSAL